MNKLIFGVAATVIWAVTGTAYGQSGAFTYQGQLKDGGVPLTDTADFQFTLWDAAGSGNPPTGGAQIGGLQAVNAQTVTSGLFTATLNASGVFGVNAFNGSPRWLQVAVRSPAGSGGFTTLSPRQAITATPYALKVAGVDGHSLDAADGTPVDALFVDNEGKVGIGRTNPAFKLDVNSSDGFGARLGMQAAGGGALVVASNPGDNRIYLEGYNSTDNGSAAEMLITGFAGGVLPQLTISAAKVGIGTGIPSSKLDISASGDGAELLRFSTERPWLFRQVRTGPSTGLQLQSTSGQKKFEITTVEGNNVATFLADGVNSKVGIGTTNPAAKLHVEGGTDPTLGGGGNIVTGSITGVNTVIGDNEIQARFNGGPFGLVINNDGGDVVFGGAIDIGYEIVATPGFANAYCPAGKKILGGGCSISGDAEIRRSYPEGNGWHCLSGDSSGVPEVPIAYAICARVK